MWYAQQEYCLTLGYRGCYLIGRNTIFTSLVTHHLAALDFILLLNSFYMQCISFWLLDAAINCIQAPLRMLLVDEVDSCKLDYVRKRFIVVASLSKLKPNHNIEAKSNLASLIWLIALWTFIYFYQGNTFFAFNNGIGKAIGCVMFTIISCAPIRWVVTAADSSVTFWEAFA